MLVEPEEMVLVFLLDDCPDKTLREERLLLDWLLEEPEETIVLDGCRCCWGIYPWVALLLPD